MGPQVDVVIPDPDMPAEADVVIIGGGIIGTSAALFLARRGVKVVLCEKGHIAGEQSSRNWGWVRKARRDPREIPLIVESLRQWERMNETIGDETGFRTTGIAFAAENDADVARYETWLDHARPFQIDARMISGADIEKHMPGNNGRWKTALYCATDGRAEPQKAAPAIARAAQKAGAVILTDCAVRGLDRAGGRVSAVVTERGRIRTTTAVLCGGAWSRRFLRDLDVTLPQLKVRASVMRTAPIEGGPETAFWFEGAAYRKRLDGGYSIANGYVNVVPIVPDSFRFLKEFWPAFQSEKKALKLRVDGRFTQEMAEAQVRPAGPGVALREDAGARPAAGSQVQPRGPGQAHAGVPRLRQGSGRPGVGRDDRRDARCRAGHLTRRRGPRPHRRHGFLGPRLRHRARRRPPRGRSRDRIDAGRRPA